MAPSDETPMLGAREHQAALRRLAEQPSTALPDRWFTATMLGGPPIPVSTRRWLRRHPSEDDDPDRGRRLRPGPSRAQTGSPARSTAFHAFQR